MIPIVTLILSILIMSAFCHGISILFWDGMIFESVGKWYNESYNLIEAWENHLQNISNRTAAGFTNECEESPFPPDRSDYLIKYLMKPIIGCVICFASFWGTIIFFSIQYITHRPMTLHIIPEWIIACVCCAFVNYKLNT